MKCISPESVDGMRKSPGLSVCSDFMEPSTCISRLTTLGFDALSVVMRHDPNAIRYDVISRLRKAKLLSGMDRLRNITDTVLVADTRFDGRVYYNDVLARSATSPIGAFPGAIDVVLDHYLLRYLAI